MELSVSIDQNQLKELLLQVGLVRPVFIWGGPGIGKSAIVEQFAAELGLPCVCLTGSQLAPEDLIGVPQIVNGTSVFCPPRCLVQKEPFCLFLDELNACSLEVQKAFYSLILERRIGEYHLPDGSIVIGAGNRMQDNAITRQLPSALINRMVHVELRPSSRVWLEWATENGIHPYVYDYLCASGPSMEPAAENGGAVFVSAQLAHAERRTVWLRRFCFSAAAVRSCIWYDFFCPRDTVSCVLQADPNKTHAQQDPVRRTAMAGCTGGQGCSLFFGTELTCPAAQGASSTEGAAFAGDADAFLSGKAASGRAHRNFTGNCTDGCLR